MKVAIVACALLTTGSLGCDGDAEGGASVDPGAPAGAPRAAAPAPEAAVSADAGTGAAALHVFTDDDFTESEANRDPFRSYEASFQVSAPVAPQRLVLMPEVGIDQMRLIAIVSGVDTPRAMLVDPAGVGHVAARGDFIGRAEIVKTGGRDSLPVTLNWRVDRIRSTEVVLSREDPSSPNRAPLTRVIALYTEEDMAGTLTKSGHGAELPQFSSAAKSGGDR